MRFPSLFAIIASGVTLIVCTITDIRKKEIPPWICAALVIVTSFDPGKDYVMSIICALIGFVPMFLSAYFGNGGGGDSLLMGALGYALSFIFALYMFLFSTVLYAIVLVGVIIATKDRKKQLPFVPFVLAGWTLTLGLYLVGVVG